MKNRDKYAAEIIRVGRFICNDSIEANSNHSHIHNVSHSSISSIVWNVILINFLLLIIFVVPNFQQIFLFYRSQFNVTGLYNDNETSEMVSALVSTMAPQIIKENQKTIVDYVNRIITQKLNNYLSTVTLVDLLKHL